MNRLYTRYLELTRRVAGSTPGSGTWLLTALASLVTVQPLRIVRQSELIDFLKSWQKPWVVGFYSHLKALFSVHHPVVDFTFRGCKICGNVGYVHR